MKKLSQKVISLVLAAAMCLSLMPGGVTALAAGEDADTDSGTAYSVTLKQTAGGTLSFADADGDRAEFSPGDEVTVRIEPDGGYAFLRITLSADDGAVYETDDTADLSAYTFTMPDAGLAVSAEFCDEADLDYSIQTLGGTVSRTSRVGSFLGEGDIAITEDEFYELFDAFMDDSHVKNTNYSQNARWDCSGMVNYFVGGYLIPYSEGTPLKDLPDEETYEIYKYKTTIQQFDSWGTVIYDDGTYGENISKLSNTNPGDLQPGDLIFYGTSKTYVTHVAMYVGQGSVLKELRNNSGYKSAGFYQVENESSANQYFYPVEGRSEYLGASGNGVRVNRFHLATSGNSYGSIYDSLIQTYDSSESAEAIMVVRLYENTPDGYLTIEKSSADTSITDGNSCYDLAGAEYTLYTDSSCKTVAEDADGKDAVLATKSDGTTNTLEMPLGTYYVKETKAAKGYLLCDAENPCANSNKGVHTVTVTTDNTEDNPATVKCADKPGNDPAGITLYKIDAETGGEYTQGAASLEGAQFTIKYYDGYYDEDTLPETATRTWVIETVYNEYSGTYVAGLRDEDCFVSGDSLYYAGNIVTLPLGTYTVQETEAPTGYLLEGASADSGNWVSENAYEAPVHVAQVTLEDNEVQPFSIGNEPDNEHTAQEAVTRFDITLLKHDSETQASLGSVEFSLTSLTTGETHYFWTDESGNYTSDAGENPHTYDTNGAADQHSGLWFYGTADESLWDEEMVDDSVGALPYDDYRLDEIKGENNEGREMIHVDITTDEIRYSGYTLDLGALNNYPSAYIHTDAWASDTGTQLCYVDGDNGDGWVTLYDDVHYYNLTPGATYGIYGVALDADTREPEYDHYGDEICAWTTFTADESGSGMEIQTFRDDGGRKEAGQAAGVERMG